MSVKGSITTADYLEFGEYKRLVISLEEDGHYRDTVYAILSFCLGLRISDILKLKWNDVIGARNVLVTEKKTGKTKVIPMSIATVKHVHELYEKLGSPDLEAPIFDNGKGNGKAVSREEVNRKLKRWKVRYNLDIGNFSSHTFRKTFGRYVYEKMGRSSEALILLNRIFRHSDISTTMIYIGLRDDEINSVFSGLAI